ncbi:DUF4157 domain-containing protein [Nitrosovibrio sp. Nv6]|uniref:eCIS core domain-containing protein n=1 Tax=Nitrosovibrio sp. Nv6 TaxID=1855340 RepID=UPI0013146328|nr:DUF4157 domain-containing protein [Nitrosovibrio sp. Nv6]
MHFRAGRILQRKCDCNHTVAGGECAECGKKEHSLQRQIIEGNGSGLNTFPLIPSIQRKLSIGASDDPLEQEADRIADQVLSMPANPPVGTSPPRVQRFTGPVSTETDVAPPSVDRVLASLGQPLEPALRQNMEQRFGYDFSGVRVHSGSAAEQSARDVNASAYTVGHNVVFGAGQFMPATEKGRRLIAHELVHVLQQGGASSPIEDKASSLGSVRAHAESETYTGSRGSIGDLQKPGQKLARSAQPISGAPRILRRTPIFDPNCGEYDRCKVIEPLRAANQLVDRVLAELPPLASGAVTTGRIVDLLNVHFHDPSNVAQRAVVVLSNYQAIKAELNANIRFICHPPAEDCTSNDGRVGAFTGDRPGGDISLCNGYHTADCREQARMLIHEICHHIPATRIDHAYVHESGYMALPADQATENPDTYAQFAKMVFLGTPACKDCSAEVQLRPGQY